jgi:uncharacterized membrane protein YidH (DUF202 family)
MHRQLLANTISNDNHYSIERPKEEFSNIFTASSFVGSMAETDEKMPDIGREQVLDIVAASEARSDAKFERLLGEVKLIAADMRTDMANIRTDIADQRGETKAVSAQVASVQTSTSGLRSTVVTTGISSVIALLLGLGALILGVATYGDAIFGRGMSVRDVVTATSKEQQTAVTSAIEAAVEKALRDRDSSRPGSKTP